MSLAADLALFSAKLDAAIDGAMQGPITDGAKQALQEAAEAKVYAAYSPQFVSRRGAGGGIADPGQMTATYGDKLLTITDDAGWQQLYGGKVPGERLAEALAGGSSRYNFHRAGPRPFHSEAERQFAGSGEFDRLLGAALRAAGFRVISV